MMCLSVMTSSNIFNRGLGQWSRGQGQLLMPVCIMDSNVSQEMLKY